MTNKIAQSPYVYSCLNREVEDIIEMISSSHLSHRPHDTKKRNTIKCQTQRKVLWTENFVARSNKEFEKFCLGSFTSMAWNIESVLSGFPVARKLQIIVG